MIITRILVAGAHRASSSQRLILTLYLADLVLAIPLVYGFRAILVQAFGNSAAMEALLPGFDFTVFQDFMNVHGNVVSGILKQGVALAMIGVIVNTFLAGGTIATLKQSGGDFSLELFFKGCGMYFFRFFRLTLMAGVLLVAAGGILASLGGIVFEKVSTGATSEIPVALTFIGVLLAVVFGMMLVLMATDYARIATVATEGSSMLRNLSRGFQFILGNFASTLGLQLLLMLILLLAVAAYWGLEALIGGMTSPLTVLAIFLIQQFWMLTRTGVRIMFFASEIALYEERKPRPATFHEWDDSPDALPV